MHITLRAGEKLYLNGAVLRADRKTSLELMNDATFLLEAHVMHPDKATTPLRQLYFIVQSMLMSPGDVAAAQALFDTSLRRMRMVYAHRGVLDALARTEALVLAKRYFEALKVLRALFATDDALVAGAASAGATAAEPGEVSATELALAS